MQHNSTVLSLQSEYGTSKIGVNSAGIVEYFKMQLMEQRSYSNQYWAQYWARKSQRRR